MALQLQVTGTIFFDWGTEPEMAKSVSRESCICLPEQFLSCSSGGIPKDCSPLHPQKCPTILAKQICSLK